MNTRIVITALLSLSLSGTVHAQEDLHFSQFYETSILRNPALTGVFESDYKVGAFYRNQWSSVTDPYETMQLNLEGRVKVSGRSSDFLSFGAVGYYDRAGALQQKIAAVYPAVNYNKSINPESNTYLSVGFAGGFLQYSFDPSKATFNNQFLNGAYSVYNPSLENLPAPRMGIFDLGGGMNFNGCSGMNNQLSYMIGISGYHFTEPVFSYYNTPGVTQNVRWNINGGMIWAANDNLVLQAHGNFAKQGSYSEAMAGALIGWRSNEINPIEGHEIHVGVLYRTTDAIVPVMKFRYRNFTVGASYDVNTSTLHPASNYQGGIELSASVIGYIPARSYYKKTVCPRF